MPRSASSECVSLPSIHELLPEHFCRPLDARSLDEPRLFTKTPPVTLGRMTLPSRHLSYHANRPSQPPSRDTSPRAHATLSPVHNADHNREDDKRHVCPFCPRRFNRPSSLAIHLNTHTGAKPFPCPACGRPFSVNSNMRRHYRNHFSAGHRSGTLRMPRFDVHRDQPLENLDHNAANANLNLTPYRYPPLNPPAHSRSTTPSTHSEMQYSDSDQDSLVSSPPTRARPERMLQGSFAARSAEWGGPYDHQDVVERMPRTSRSTSLQSLSLRPATSSAQR